MMRRSACKSINQAFKERDDPVGVLLALQESQGRIQGHCQGDQAMDKVEIEAKDGPVSPYREFSNKATEELKCRPCLSVSALKGLQVKS